MVKHCFLYSVPFNKPVKKPSLSMKTYATFLVTTSSILAEDNIRVTSFVYKCKPMSKYFSPAFSDVCYKCGKAEYFVKDCYALH